MTRHGKADQTEHAELKIKQRKTSDRFDRDLEKEEDEPYKHSFVDMSTIELTAECL